MSEENAFRFAEFAHPVAVKGKVRRNRILLLTVLALASLAYVLLTTVAIKLPQLIALLPLFIWIVLMFTWRYVSYECATRVEDGTLSFARLFGMDGVIFTAFLLGWPANEIVIPLMLMMYLSTGSMVEMENYTALHQILTANGWTWQTAASVLVFSLFHWPCSTTCLTIKKETGSWFWTLVAILLPTLFGCILCITISLIF